MREYLDKIRKPVSVSTNKKILYSILIFIMGITLGVVSKMLDETASNLLPVFLEILDLRNFFSRIGFWLFSGICISIYSKTPLHAASNIFLFFAGMVSSYYLYTALIAGFYPRFYMMIWITMTVISPFMGIICWYAKGTHIVSIVIAIFIFAMAARQSFSFGFWYFDVRHDLELLLFLATTAILYKTPKQIFMVVGFGVVLFFIMSPINLFLGML